MILLDPSRAFAGYVEPDSLRADGLRAAQGCSGVGILSDLALPILGMPRPSECFLTDDVWVSDAFKKLGIKIDLLHPGDPTYRSTRIDSDNYSDSLAARGATDEGGLYYVPEAGKALNRGCAAALSPARQQGWVPVCIAVFLLTAILILCIRRRS